MLRIKPASYQDQTKSDTESEYQPKGGENSLPIENSFQKETRNDTQEGKTIPRMNIRISCHIRGVGFLFVWGVGSVCVRACVCVYTHAQATVRTLPSLGIKTAFSPRAGRTKLLWAVFTSRRGQDLTFVAPSWAAVPDQMYHTQKEPAPSAELGWIIHGLRSHPLLRKPPPLRIL